MNQWKGAPYAAMRFTSDKGRTYRWGVFPMPRGESVARFRGPFAERRARRRARKLSRQSGWRPVAAPNNPRTPVRRPR